VCGACGDGRGRGRGSWRSALGRGGGGGGVVVSWCRGGVGGGNHPPPLTPRFRHGITPCPSSPRPLVPSSPRPRALVPPSPSSRAAIVRAELSGAGARVPLGARVLGRWCAATWSDNCVVWGHHARLWCTIGGLWDVGVACGRARGRDCSRTRGVEPSLLSGARGGVGCSSPPH